MTIHIHNENINDNENLMDGEKQPRIEDYNELNSKYYWVLEWDKL